MSRVHYLEGDYEQLVINETIDGRENARVKTL